jgi:K+-transporting ATPase ATPase C chain
MMRSMLRPALSLFALLSLLTGIVYPLLVTALAQALLPEPANGSLIRDESGHAVASRLIGQPFQSRGYFWGRPSATTPFPYNAAASAGSNLAPSNPALRAAVAQRIEALRAADPEVTDPVPVDLVTASGSGLDPHISPAAALCQVRRVAGTRGLPEARVRALVLAAVEPPTFAMLGEARVNVVVLNRALDQLN